MQLSALVHYFTRDLNLILTDITRQAFIICSVAGNLNFLDSKVHASTSITLQAYRVLAGGLRHA